MFYKYLFEISSPVSLLFAKYGVVEDMKTIGQSQSEW